MTTNPVLSKPRYEHRPITDKTFWVFDTFTQEWIEAIQREYVSQTAAARMAWTYNAAYEQTFINQKPPPAR